MNLVDNIKNLNEEKIISLIISILIICILNIFSPIFTYLILKLFNLKKNKNEIKENPFYIPLKLFFRITGIYLALVFLKQSLFLSKEFIEIVTKIYKIILTITLSSSLANSITRKSRIVLRIKEKSNKDIDDSATKIMIRLIKLLIYLIAGFIIFTEIGYDLSGLVTGLGLGSVVLTLAAQDTIKNLLGGIVIFVDKPFKAGDYIKVNNYQGTVEDMTFRSTKIRTLDNSIVQIPNSVVASESIENISKIQRRRYKLDVEVVLNTKIEKIEMLKNNIFKILMRHENVIMETINIHFNQIGTNGLNIMVICYLNISDYYEFLDIQEDINKQIIEIIEKNQIDLAYETKTIEIKNYR